MTSAPDDLDDNKLYIYKKSQIFFWEFQTMTSAPDDPDNNSLSSDQDTNQFLV